MKKAIFAILTFLQISVMAYAGEYTTQGAYVGGIAGVNLLYPDHHVKTHPGFNLGAFAGYKFVSCENPCLNLRLEGEISYRRNTLKSFRLPTTSYKVHGFTDSMTLMANAFYDFETNTRWTPYVGIGIGYIHDRIHTKCKLEGKTVGRWGKGSEDGFASQYIGGVAYRICDGMDLGLEYRYLLAREHCNEHTVAFTVKQYF